MFIPKKDGSFLKVDSEEKYPRAERELTAYSDDVELKEIWHLEILRNLNPEIPPNLGKDVEMTFLVDLLYDHNPSKNEILWALGKYDAIYDGIIRITKEYIIE